MIPWVTSLVETCYLQHSYQVGPELSEILTMRLYMHIKGIASLDVHGWMIKAVELYVVMDNFLIELGWNQNNPETTLTSIQLWLLEAIEFWLRLLFES